MDRYTKRYRGLSGSALGEGLEARTDIPAPRGTPSAQILVSKQHLGIKKKKELRLLGEVADCRAAGKTQY